MNRALTRTVVILAILFSAWSAQAQQARLSGQVTDPQGAVVPGAVVQFVNQSTKATLTATADAVGHYQTPPLGPGTYNLSVKVQGFTPFETELTLAAGQVLELDIPLSLAANRSEVNVSGTTTTQVETQTAELAGMITAGEVPTIGLNGRNFTQLTTLVAGVSNQTGQDEARVGMAGSVSFSVNGGRTEYNSFQLDGAELINAGLYRDKTSLIVTPSIDAIQDIKVLTSNYGAMYPSAGNGTTIVTTKSGTDALHGSAYEFLRNEMFNAKGFFDVGNRAPLYRRHDFGGTIGGPVVIPRVYNGKGKSYFFFSEEARLEKDPYAYRQAVPSAAERNSDFSDVCPILPPGQTVTYFRRTQYPDCPANSIDPDRPNLFLTFPNNTVPLDRNALIVLGTGVIPLPTAPYICKDCYTPPGQLPVDLSGGCNSSIGSCYNFEVTLPTSWREELFRFDRKLSNSVNASVRYVHDAWKTTTNVPQFTFVRNNFPTIQNQFYGPGTNIVVRLTKASAPGFLNDFSVSYRNQTITLDNIPAANVTLRGADLLAAGGTGMTTIFNNGGGGKMPGLVVAGNNQAYGGRGFSVDAGFMPWQHSNPTYSVTDNISRMAGKHLAQGGVQVVFYQRNQTNGAIGAATGETQGIMTFSNVIGANSTGNSFADFLSGRSIASFQQDSAQGRYRQRFTIVEPFLQDDYRVNARLNLNLGLRVSLFGTFHELNNNAFSFVPAAYNQELGSTLTVGGLGQLVDKGTGRNLEINPNAPRASLDPRLRNGLVHCGTNHVPSGCMLGRVVNPAPRIGFAWQPFGSGKTSVRGGYGMFFVHGTANEANTGSLEGAAPLVLSMAQLNPANWSTIGVAGDGMSLVFPLNVTAIPTKAVWPYVQQWSLSVQQELAPQTLLSVAYVGSKGTNLPVQLQINQLEPVEAQDNPYGPGQPLVISGFNATTTDVYHQINGDCGFNMANGIPTSSTLVNGTVVSGTALTNLLAACYGIGQNRINPNLLRQRFPGFGEIYSIQNAANSSYNSLQVTFRRNVAPLMLGVAYTYSHSIDNASDRSDATFVNSYDLQSNRASSNFDQRHLLNISYIYRLPSLRWFGRLWNKSLCSEEDVASNPACAGVTPDAAPAEPEWMRKWFDNWELSGVTTVQTGIPFTVVNYGSPSGIGALDNAGVANGTGSGSYPDLCGDPYGAIPTKGNNSSSFGPLLLNPGAFCAPRGLTFGNSGRNALRNPGRWNVDLTLLKRLNLNRESKNLEFRMEVFNVFNNTQFMIYDPSKGNQANNTVSCYGGLGSNYSAAGGDGVDCLTGSAFLHPVSAHRPRTIQFGLKLLF